MANIPVEKTSTGTPWWVWLLGLLLLAALIWLIASLFGDDDDVAVAPIDDDVEVVDEPNVLEPAPSAAATGVPAFGDISSFDLSSMYVTRVTGDRAFFVSPTEDGAEEALVLLDQNMSPDVGGIEGQVDINPGQMVDVSDGSVEPFGDMDASSLGIPDNIASAMTADTEVIRIDGGDVEIMEADLQNVEVGE